MAFYVKPPEGSISLSKLYRDAETRLLFLYQVHHRWGDIDQMHSILTDHPSIASNSDCLIEGSRKDRISHFLLRLLCEENGQFQRFLTEAEAQLFQYRLESGGEPAIMHCVSDLKRHSRFSLKHMALTPAHHKLMMQVQRMSNEILTSGMVECFARMRCHHAVKVPWTIVLSLVKERNVAVIAGEVEIQCQMLVQLLCSVFKLTLEFGIKQLLHCRAQDLLINDSRMNQMKKSLHSLYKKQQGSLYVGLTSHSLSYRDVEGQVPYFPLCMQELHKILSSTKRLRHHARIRYTLFLKDIGLPVMENIALWESFYSKAHTGTSTGCSHSWEGCDRKRYTYGIKHLYGIEGSRTNYTSHSCSSLQALWSQPSDTGGCPFTSCGQEDLSFLLSPILGNNTHLLEAIKKEVKAGRPNAACKTLLAFTIFTAREYKRRQEYKLNHKCHGSLNDQDEAKNDKHYTPLDGENRGALDFSVDTSLSKTHKKQTISYHISKKQIYSNENSVYPGINDHSRRQEKIGVQSEKEHCKFNHCRISSQDTKLVEANSLLCSKNHDAEEKNVQNCQKARKFSGSCSHIKKESHKIDCDIEDLEDIILECNFLQPSHYYLRAKSESNL